MLKELKFLTLSKHYIKTKYFRNIAVFEVGYVLVLRIRPSSYTFMASVHEKSIEKSFKNSIDKVLYKRKVGIDYIKFGKYKLENIHDINQLMDYASDRQKIMKL